MAHPSNSINLFTKYSSLVAVESTPRGPEFVGNPERGCANIDCNECVFATSEECYIDTSSKSYTSILTYFQTHHPEKLI